MLLNNDNIEMYIRFVPKRRIGAIWVRRIQYFMVQLLPHV